MFQRFVPDNCVGEFEAAPFSVGVDTFPNI